MRNRSYLLSSTACSLAFAVSSPYAYAQTTTVMNGNGGTGTVITTDTALSANLPNGQQANANIQANSATLGSANTSTVYTGYKTAGGNGSGGGAGLGGVFFIDTGTSLQLNNVSFVGNTVVGGQGGGVKIDSAAPTAFSVTSSKTDASAYLQYGAGTTASYSQTLDANGNVTSAQVSVTALTVPLTSVFGQGSGVGLVKGAYTDSVTGITPLADGINETVTLAQPFTFTANSGSTYGVDGSVHHSDGTWSFADNGPTAIQPGESVVGANIPAGVVVDQVQRDGNNNITGFTSKFASGGSYIVGNNATVYVVTSQTYDFSRFATSLNGSNYSNILEPTGALGGFVVGQTVTGTGVPTGTTVLGVSPGTDPNTGSPIIIVNLSNNINLQTATDLKASLTPVDATGTKVTLSSLGNLAVGETISGTGITTGTTITDINQATNTVTLSNPLSTLAIATINNTSLVLAASPILKVTQYAATPTSGAYATVKLASTAGYVVNEEISGPGIDANARIKSIDATTNTITYMVDPTLATANAGGSLNSLVAPVASPGNGGDGTTGQTYSSTFDNGEGAPGTNGGAGSGAYNAIGSNGGGGGTGSNGSSTNKTLITTLALDTASLAVDFLNTGDDSAGVFTLPHVPGDIAAAVVDAAHVAFDATQLTAWQLAEQAGLVALGGSGGQGGAGGSGSKFFGGGAGGGGGNGGNGAESNSIGGASGNGGAGGAGGFGAGGGNGGAAGVPGVNGAPESNGNGGAAGFGGGVGSSADQGGQGGSGFGGAIFVRGDGISGGTLTISGNALFQNNVALAGSSNNGGASGQAAGGDLFMMKGATVTLTPGIGNTISFYDSIADDSAASISGSTAAGQGTPLTIGGGGTVQLFGTDTYTGATIITGATVEAQDGVGINPFSQIQFNGSGTIGNLSTTNVGVLLSGGTITRAIGTGPTNVDFVGSGGFAGTAANLVLNFGGPSGVGQTLTWGVGGFVPTGRTLVFGSDATDATGTVTLQNAINLAGGTGQIAVYHNAGETASYDAAITGAISNGSLTVGDTGYTGTLLLSAQNSLSGITLNDGTVSTINGAQIGRLMNPTTGGSVQVNDGTLQLGGAETLTTVNVAAGGALLAAAPITAGAINNAGITGFGSTLTAASIDNSGVLGLMGATTVTGAITNEPDGILRQLGATSAASVANAGIWTLAADLTTPTLTNSGEIDVVGTVANSVETAATRTVHVATFTGTAGSLVNLGGIAGTVANQLVIDQSGNSTDPGIFTGAGGLTKAGGGTLTLTGASTFTGGLTVAAGTLDTTGGGTFADTLDVAVKQSATLIVGTADTVHAVTNAGTLNGKAAYTVASLTNSGTATFNAAFAASGAVANTGTLTFAGASSQIGGAFTNSGTATAAGQFGVAGAASNAGQLTLLTGSTTHFAGGLVNTGTLSGSGHLLVDGQLANPQGGTVRLLNGGTTQLASLVNAGSLTANSPLNVTGIVANSGTLTLGTASAPTFGSLVNTGTISSAAALAVAGGYEQDAGTLTANAGLSTGSLSGAGGAIVLNGASVFAINQTGDASYAGSIAGTGSVVKNGGATLTLAGGQGSIAPTALAVMAGQLVVQQAGALAPALVVGVAAPATLTLAADQSIATLTNQGAVLLGGDLTTSGALSDDGVLTVTGAAGVRRTVHTASFTGGAGGVVNLGGVTGADADTLVIDQSGNSTYAGTFTGAGSLTKAGAGALTLTGANTFTGGLTVAAGTLTLTAANGYAGATSIANGATLALTGAGAIATSAGVTDNGLFSIAGTTAGASITSLAGMGTVDLGAQTLTLTNAAGTFAGVVGGSGGLVIGAGVEALSGINTYTGATVIAAPATLALTGNGAIATSAGLVDNGIFDISGSAAGVSLTTLAGNGQVVLGGQSLTLTSAGNGAGGTFTGTVIGAGGLTIGGGGETLANASGYTGITTIGNGATLTLTGVGSIAASAGVIDNGRFDISGTSAGASITSLSGAGTVGLGGQQLTLTNAAGTFAGTVDGSGGITLAGGTEYLAGVNSYTGPTIVDAGATLGLVGGGSIATSAGLLDNGTFAIGATTAGASLATLAGSGTVTLGGQTLTLINAGSVFAGSIAGAGGLTVAGGAEVLTGANGYTGATYVAPNAGLMLSGAGAIAASSVVDVDGGLDLSQATTPAIRSLAGAGTVLLGANGLQLTAAADTFAGAIVGSGGVEVAGGTETLTGTNFYSGRTLIDAGARLALAGAGSLTGTAGISDNGTFDLSAANGPASIQQLDGAGTIVLGANPLAIVQASGAFAGSITGPGGLAILGGAQTLTGVSSYTGGTTVSHASLSIGSDAALGAAAGPLALDTATLRFLAPTTSVRATSLAGAVTLDTDGNAVAMNGVIGGGGTLFAVGGGTLALGAANSFGGGTQVTGATTLRIGTDAALGAPTATLLIGNGTLQASADVSIGRPVLVGQQARFDSAGHVLALTNTLYGQAAAGYEAIASGGFKLTGTLDVAPATGGFTLGASSLLRGTGTFNRAMLVNGTLAPGNSPGTMTFTAPVTIAPGGTLSLDIDGTGTGTGGGNYSRLILTGAGSNFTAGGTLRPVLRGITGSATNIYSPALGQSFVLVQTPTAVVGSFAQIAQPTAGLLPGTRIDVAYTDNITAYVTPVSYTDLSPAGVTLTQNEAAVGGALDALRGTAGTRPDPAVGQFLATVYALDTASLPRFEDHVAGGIYTDVQRLAAAREQAFGRTVDAQVDAIARAGTQLWATGYGQDFDLGTSRAHNTFGFAGGLGVRVRDDMVVGIAAGHDTGSLSQLASGNHADVDLTHVTLYAAYTGSHAYARLRAGATRASINSVRAIPELGVTATGHTDGWGFAGSVEAGYAAQLGGWSLTPSLAVRSAQVHLGAFTEAGGGPVSLTVNHEAFNNVQGVAKLSVAHDFELSPGGRLRPQLDFGYVRELGDRAGRTTEAFAVAPTTTFDLASIPNGRDSFRLGAGVTADTASGVTIFARGDIDTQANVKARSASVGLAYRW